MCLFASDRRKLVQKRLHRLIVSQKLEEKLDWNACSGKHSEAAAGFRIAFDELVNIHERVMKVAGKQSFPSPQKHLGLLPRTYLAPHQVLESRIFLFTIFQ